MPIPQPRCMLNARRRWMSTSIADVLSTRATAVYERIGVVCCIIAAFWGTLDTSQIRGEQVEANHQEAHEAQEGCETKCQEEPDDEPETGGQSPQK